LKVKLHHNIIIEEVNLDNIDLLRKLRNNDSLKSILSVNKKITKEEQIRWFESIDKCLNFYFLIYINNQLKGYCLLKNIDFAKKIGEPGIFLIDKNLWNSTLGSILTIAYLDFCTDSYNLEYFFGNVLHSNTKAKSNYQLFETNIYKDSEKETFLMSSMKYCKMNKINKIRKILEDLENYQRDFQIID